MFTVSEIIDIAIRIEENGEKIYRDASKKASDPSLVNFLQWLANEESQHVQWFFDLKRTVREVSVDPELAEMGRSLLQEIVGEQSFSLKENDLSTIGDLNEVLKIALNFERDTAIFYEMIGSFLQEDADMAKLDQIILEENRHVKILSEFLQKGKVQPLERM